MADSPSEASASPEVFPGDPLLRRVVIFLLLAGTLAGCYAIWQLHESLNSIGDVAQSSPGDAIKEAFGLVHLTSMFGMVVFTCFGLYYAWFAFRVWRAGQYPPPGAFVLSDMPLRRGLPAMRRATGMAAIAVLLIAVGTGGMWAFERTAQAMFRQNLNATPAAPAVAPRAKSPASVTRKKGAAPIAKKPAIVPTVKPTKPAEKPADKPVAPNASPADKPTTEPKPEPSEPTSAK